MSKHTFSFDFHLRPAVNDRITTANGPDPARLDPPNIALRLPKTANRLSPKRITKRPRSI